MLAFGMPMGWEWIVILIIALLLFGPRLPSVMRSMGKSISELRKGMHEVEDDITSAGEGGDDDAAGEGSGEEPSTPAG